MSAAPHFSPAARAQSRRKPTVRATVLPGDPDPLAGHPALAADLHAANDSHVQRAELACRALRDAPVSDALMVQIAETAPDFAAALAFACDCADESEG